VVGIGIDALDMDVDQTFPLGLGRVVRLRVAVKSQEAAFGIAFDREDGCATS
jgi:hypothetical protein